MKKTTILTLILCTCIVQVNWGAEAKQTSLEKTLTIEPIALTTQFKKPNEPRPVYKVTSSIPLWFTDIQHRIAKNIPVDAKDRAFVERLRFIVVIGNLGGIIYGAEVAKY